MGRYRSRGRLALGRGERWPGWRFRECRLLRARGGAGWKMGSFGNFADGEAIFGRQDGPSLGVEVRVTSTARGGGTASP